MERPTQATTEPRSGIDGGGENRAPSIPFGTVSIFKRVVRWFRTVMSSDTAVYAKQLFASQPSARSPWLVVMMRGERSNKANTSAVKSLLTTWTTSHDDARTTAAASCGGEP